MNRSQALAEIGGKLWQSVSQDAGLLKDSSAFWATLVHSALRIAIANDSAKRPAATPQEKRFHEAASAMTFFREGVGVTLGWGVLKVGEALQARGADRLLGYEVAKTGVLGPVKAIKLAVAALINPAKVDIPHVPTAITGDVQLRRVAGRTVPAWAEKALIPLGRFAFRRFEPIKKSAEEIASKTPAQLADRGYKFFRGNIPKLTMAPIAIGVAGWWLERTTLLHGDDVVNALLGDKDGPKKSLPERLQSIGAVGAALAGKEVPHRPFNQMSQAPAFNQVAPSDRPKTMVQPLTPGVNPLQPLAALSV